MRRRQPTSSTGWVGFKIDSAPSKLFPFGSSAERLFHATVAAWLSYTRRFNSRHHEWGRLFGDRYKSILVESGGSGGDLYLRTLLDYIHLNPVRAGLVPSESFAGLLDYPWSSLSRAYAMAPKAREPWMAVAEGFALF